MARRTRDPKKEASWRKLTSGQQHSGQTVREYCRANALAESSFWFWKRELARRDAEKPSRRPGGQSLKHHKGRQRTPRLPALVPVTIGPAVSTTAPIEVLLSRGVSVRVSAGCDEAMLSMVLSVLESGA
jgi:hypothetical protein